jgi:N4-gp56 family major capsid protein
MAYNTNLTTTGGLSAEMQTYYDRQLLENMKPKLVHYEYGQKRPYKRQNGKTVQFRKWTPFEAITSPLTEGVIPDGQALASTDVQATVAGYGGYVAISDLLDLTAIDPVVSDAVDLMADQGALSIDTIIRDALHTTGTNVIYAGAATSRNTVAQGMKLTTTEIRKAARLLKKNKALPFVRGGKSYYIAIVGPDTTYDLQSDTLWQDVGKYQDAEAIFSGEIGRLFGVIFVETSEAKIFAGAGASNADVASTLVLGQNAYGVVDIENGSRPRAVVKTPGESGTSDPLEQISTVGWKVDAFAAKVLQQGFMVRIEHGISA